MKKKHASNADEQKRQIEVLWDVMKILREEARWHSHGNAPIDDEEYRIWAARSLAAYDFIYKLMDQRLGLLRHSLQHDGAVNVGSLDTLLAIVKDDGNVTDNCTGGLFTTKRGQELLADLPKCDKAGVHRYDPPLRFDRL